MKRTITIKVTMPEWLITNVDYDDDEENVAKNVNEWFSMEEEIVELYAQNIPNIVTAMRVSTDDHCAYVVIEQDAKSYDKEKVLRLARVLAGLTKPFVDITVK